MFRPKGSARLDCKERGCVQTHQSRCARLRGRASYWERVEYLWERVEYLWERVEYLWERVEYLRSPWPFKRARDPTVLPATAAEQKRASPRRRSSEESQTGQALGASDLTESLQAASRRSQRWHRQEPRPIHPTCLLLSRLRRRCEDEEPT